MFGSILKYLSKLNFFRIFLCLTKSSEYFLKTNSHEAKKFRRNSGNFLFYPRFLNWVKYLEKFHFTQFIPFPFTLGKILGKILFYPIPIALKKVEK